MKIIIGGSMAFAVEQLKVKKELENLGHQVDITPDLNHYINSPKIKNSFEEELNLCLKSDVMRKFFNKISENDAFLVCNYDKNNIKGYLGISVLMELGVAYHLNKKIYLLNDFDRSQGYGLEVAIISPEILNGDLSKIE
jgi:hypothetical protein